MLNSRALIILSVIIYIVIAADPEPTPTPEQRKLAEVYSNFSIGVVAALAKDDSAVVPMPVPPGAPALQLAPVSLTSLFGLTHILSVINEKPWPVAVPVFESLLTSTPKNLPDSYALLAATTENDKNIKLSSLIFTSEKLKLSPELSKLKVEAVNMDLKASEAVNTINSKIDKQLLSPLEEPYIPKDFTLSPAAIAILTDTLHIKESWPVPLKKISGVKFNGKEEVDMIEMVGKFQVVESDKAVEVFIPFKNPKRAITIVLPYDMTAVTKGDLGKLVPLNLTSVKIQLPALKFKVRGPHATFASSSKCEFKKEPNILQLLDEYAVMVLDEEKFESISITAAQINNVEAFKKELAKAPKEKFSTLAAVVPPKETLLTTSAPSTKLSPPKSSAVAGEEKVIVFDRPFSWTILDENLGPLFAGSVESLAFLKNNEEPLKLGGTASEPLVFGSNKILPYEKCL